MKPTNTGHRESEQVPDVNSSEDLAEIELVSLLEDELPNYQLRTDSLFLYHNEDWVQPSSYPHNTSTPRASVLVEEPFKYMVLNAERVDHSRKNCSDVDVVHMLAEKDRDVELAARIGQALLKQNHALKEKNESLEDHLAQAYDQINQLQHELQKKEELLRVVSIASEESETDSSCSSTPLPHIDSFSLSQGLLHLDVVQNKLKELEEENLRLRSEACDLQTETVSYEQKEQQLITECVKQLRDSNAQISFLTEELSRKGEEVVQLQEEISNLLSQIIDLQHKVKEHTIEKEELKLHLQASKEAQKQLTKELHELRDVNEECTGMLHESLEEIKELRNRSLPSTTLRRPQSYGLFPMDSLAAEIEGTLRRQKSSDEGDQHEDQKKQQKRVFNTVKIANGRSRSLSSPPLMPIPGSHGSSITTTTQPFQHTSEAIKGAAALINEASDHCSQVHSQLGNNSLGEKDLAVALHRLALRRDNYLSEKQFFDAEQEKKMQTLEAQEMDEHNSNCSSPTGSTFSIGTHRSDFTDISGVSSGFRAFMHEKLQIVKPIEGSLTLYHWQQLAQPNLNNILDLRPGVLTKGFRMLPDDNLYHLDDLEEEEEEGITFQVHSVSSPPDEENKIMPKPVTDIFLPPLKPGTSPPAPPSAANPGKCLSFTNSTFTFTTCRILHPSDITQVTSSSMYSGMPNGGNTSGPIMSDSPVVSSYPKLGQSLTNRKNSTTTLSTSSNLATLLQEHGISARVYSSPVSGKIFSLKPQKIITAPSTPPNSPSQSLCPSPVLFDSRGTPTETFLASKPAESFLQEKYVLKPSCNSLELNQRKMSLVERLKKLGIAKVVKPEGVRTGNGQQLQDSLLPQGTAPLFIGNGSILMGGLRRNKSHPSVIVGLSPQGGTSAPLTTVGQCESMCI